MGESRPRNEERRKSPRFSVGGWATVHCLPLEGKPIPALVRNLSVGGVCLDVRPGLELGTRTELLVCVNSEVFRAAALVRGQREVSNACFQFVQISQRARSVLQDLIEGLTKQQVLARRLRSGEIDEEIKQALFDIGRFRLLAVGEDERFAADTGNANTESEGSPRANPPERNIVSFEPRLIEVDLFG